MKRTTTHKTTLPNGLEISMTVGHVDDLPERTNTHDCAKCDNLTDNTCCHGAAMCQKIEALEFEAMSHHSPKTKVTEAE